MKIDDVSSMHMTMLCPLCCWALYFIQPCAHLLFGISHRLQVLQGQYVECQCHELALHLAKLGDEFPAVAISACSVLE